MDCLMDRNRLDDIRGVALHDPCSGRGCDGCNNTGTNYRVSVCDWVRMKDELLGEIDRLMHELNVVTNFKPDSEHVNQLPEAIRSYIHDLITLCDPGGLVQENAALRDQNAEVLAHIRS